MREYNRVFLSDIFEARHTIRNLVSSTPLIESAPLANLLGHQAMIKLEIAQETGSFKVRGAANRLLNFTPKEKERGVIAVSTGNHGRAVSFVAQKLDIPCYIYLSCAVPENKVKAIRDFNAELVIAGNSYDEAFDEAVAKAEEERLTLVPPFDDFHVIAGQGTIGLELLEACKDIDTVIVPVSGGGLISGIALALKEANPSIQVIGVCMERGATMRESLTRGKPVVVEELDTLADSLKGGIGLNNRFTFSMTQKYVDDLILVSEGEILEALRFALREMRIVLEGAACVGIAALLAGKLPKIQGTTVFILSGQNIDMETFNKVR